MPGKLFIGNLSFNTTDDGMTELFSGMSIPTTGIRIVRDPDTGRSRGFAFAELAPEADLESAITQLNGKILDGRPLTVNEARKPKPREFRGHGGSGGSNRFDQNNRNQFSRPNGSRDARGNRRPRAE
jgi:RNA recognition motif-containing protein